jgi:hypothetical protein
VGRQGAAAHQSYRASLRRRSTDLHGTGLRYKVRYVDPDGRERSSRFPIDVVMLQRDTGQIVTRVSGRPHVEFDQND